MDHSKCLLNSHLSVYELFYRVNTMKWIYLFAFTSLTILFQVEEKIKEKNLPFYLLLSSTGKFFFSVQFCRQF